VAIKRSATPRWRQLANRVGIGVLAFGLVWFAVEGGEYGTTAVFAQHAKRERLDLEVQQLRADVDSLEREKTALIKNDAVLERIAREQYGMLRGNKEMLFWMNNPTVAKDSSAVGRRDPPSEK
jgi:cell division protein FtsB